jgi:probable F420-dependent oxidoreductase
MATPEIGVALPNFGPAASAQGVRRTAEAAQELGLDSVWLTDHLLVGRDAAQEYGQVLEPLAALTWLAGRLEGLALGTSILLLALRNPVQVAKQAAFLQEVSGGRFRLGVGVGWHRPEYQYLGVRFEDRGARTEEAIRLLRALWRGEGSFQGRWWSFDGAFFGPIPDPPPEVWIGGNGSAARRRARTLGDAWHPGGPTADEVAAVRRTWDGRIVPRFAVSFDHDGQQGDLAGSPGAVAAGLARLLEAGADGFVLSFGNNPDLVIRAMRTVAREVLPRLRGQPGT